MGIERGVAQTALRFSFAADVTAEALATAAGDELAAAVGRMQRLGPSRPEGITAQNWH